MCDQKEHCDVKTSRPIDYCSLPQLTQKDTSITLILTHKKFVYDCWKTEKTLEYICIKNEQVKIMKYIQLLIEQLFEPFMQ